MKVLGMGALALGFAMGTAVQAATVMDVSWGGQTQSITTLSGPGTAAAFYGLDAGSATLPMALDPATIYAFLHDSTTTGALAFGMIFTGADVATPNPTCVASKGGDPSLCRTRFQGTLSGAPDDSTVSVKDDPINSFGDRDGTAPGANGLFDLAPFTGATDGFVVDGIGYGTTLTLTSHVMEGFDSLVFLGGRAAAPTQTTFSFSMTNADLSLTLPVAAAGNTPGMSVIPLPAGALLLVSAFGVAGLLRLRAGKRT